MTTALTVQSGSVCPRCSRSLARAANIPTCLDCKREYQNEWSRRPWSSEDSAVALRVELTHAEVAVIVRRSWLAVAQHRLLLARRLGLAEHIREHARYPAKPVQPAKRQPGPCGSAPTGAAGPAVTGGPLLTDATV